MEPTYYTLGISIQWIAERYHVELSHSDPSSDAQIAPTRGIASFDLDRLGELTDPEQYGAALTEQLFSCPEITQRFLRVETAAQASESFLRVRVSIDPSAQELLALRWELLRHPQSGAAIGTSETLLLSRFMVSRDWRPVKLRAKAKLRALVAVSAPEPDTLERMGLASVDYAGEFERIEQALPGIEVETLGGPGSPLTIDRLMDVLRSGVDILYLVSHGMFGRRTGTPALILQDEEGRAQPVEGEALATRIGELQKGPLLVVLASCQSAGDGVHASRGRTTVQASLAGRLADAGVPGVIAMQGFVSMETVARMMPVFFTEPLRDGQIDRALAVARGRVRGRDDSWMPALYSRLTKGCLWYTQGFRGKRSKDVWQQLIKPIARGKVVPIIGPRLLEAAHGSSHETARRLAGANNYPLPIHEWDDLPRVTGFMSVKESRYNVIQAYQDQLVRDLIEQHRSWLPPEMIPPANKKPRLSKLLGLVGERLRQEPDDPHMIVAGLPASVYVTTNFDPMLEWSLMAKGKKPQQVCTPWRYRRKPLSNDELDIKIPGASSPLVYHVFGALGPKAEDGLVLTERDYFDYLINANSGGLLPSEVESALVDNSLLFLGFRLTDWHFRVLFRLMMNLPGRDKLKDYCHVAVQLDPDLQTMADVEGAKEYLAEYFGKEANIDIYWGSAEEFLCVLREELANTGELEVEPLDDDDDDEWGLVG